MKAKEKTGSAIEASGPAHGSANELPRLRQLRTRIYNIGTGLEMTPDDNDELNLIVRIIEDSYLPNDPN